MQFLNIGVFPHYIYYSISIWQLIILFPPANRDSNNSVQFNAFASKAAKNTVVMGTSVMIENFLMTVLSERYFPIFAN